MYQYFNGDYVHGPYEYLDDYHADERWWYVDGVPGYMVSDKGRVWAEKTRKFLKAKTVDNHGHLGFCLSVNGRPHYVYLHRIMAEAFIPNPNNYPIVRHLDDDPSNNELANLAWGTQKDNHRDSVLNGSVYYLTDEDREKGFVKVRKPVIGTNLITGKKTRFRGQSEAARILGLQQANVWKVLNGVRPKTGNYIFEYA